ncbi:MAG TPA: mucoidy inhibitor MuiA family protein [bacterium]|nr:mucoidy inhibitor MuiA family protein [bacterium]HQG44573.1 mucoidy inhibitor MuiA family protein [bacterium]HQI49765.1 mucoidy inhibitor MuiA family protein [bacterium]HQJ63918.1 mucoidy inhibitor MuiA family protein [bacterium]
MGKKVGLLLLLAGSLSAADIESRIVRVTVYPGMALVERQASPVLQAGTNPLVLNGLPAALVDESVHARITSGQGLVLDEVNVEKWFLARSGESEIHKLEEAIRDLERQISQQEGEQKNLVTREKFLQSIQATTIPAAGQTAAAMRPDPASWNSTLSYLGTALQKIYDGMVEVEFKIRELKADKEALEKQLAEQQSAKPREEKSITLNIRAEKPVTGQISLTYLVNAVEWWPAYEFRALPAERSLELIYSGMVRQKTGEDWEDVELVLSTAQPAREATAPEPSPWNVRIWEPTRAFLKSANAEMETSNLKADLTNVAGAAAAPSQASVEERSTSVLFAIPGVHRVASGDEPGKVLIARKNFAAQMNYITLPRRSPFVYFQGRFTHDALYPLLQGPAMIYVDGDYVGRTTIKPLAAGESVDLSLGIDEGLKVKRELVKKFERNTGTLSKKREIEYDYRITVASYKKEAVEVKVVDHLPRSQQDEIEVSDVRLLPEPALWDKDQQQLTWSLTLKPGEKRELNLHFTISYPRDARVTGLE